MDKKITGYTTGVYDMFHIGHLNLIRRAKEQCDYLIVGVSTDECVKKYKNKSSVIPFEERIEIIKALKYVDEVVPQISMDKFEAWKNLKFDVLFHGSDWKGSDLYNKYEEQFSKVGVDIIYLPHTDGISSTKLTNLIKNLL